MGGSRLSSLQRFESLGRVVHLDVEVSLATAVRLRAYAAGRGLTLEQAVSDAIGWWGIREEQHAARRRRIAVERAMRQAAEWDPIGEVLAAAWKPGVEDICSAEDLRAA